MTLPELIADSPTPNTDQAEATLGAGVATAPAAGTVETWTVSNAARAVLNASPGQWHAVVDHEIVLIDASTSSTTSWSVTRGIGGTIATHPNGTAIYHRPTKDGLDARYARQGTDATVGGPSGTPISPVFNVILGSKQVWFGHSYLAANGATHLDRQFVTMLSGMMRCDLVDLGNGGAQLAADQLWLQPTNGGGSGGWGGWAWALQNINPLRTGAPYTPGVNYLPCLMHGTNDVLQRSHQATGSPRNIFKAALRTVLSRWCASKVFEDAATFFSGTLASASPSITGVNRWSGLVNGLKLAANGIPADTTIFSVTPGSATITMSANASASGFSPIFAYDPSITYGGVTWGLPKMDCNKNSGYTYWPIPANGATITITLPADFEGGVVAVGFCVWPGSDGTITWSGTAAGQVGGVALSAAPTTALAGLAYADGTDAATQNTVKRHSSNGLVVRITGLTAADAGKTIIATYGGGAGATFATPAAPGAITHGGTAGSTTYGYKRMYRTYNGDTIPSAETTTTTGNATLSATNTNVVPAGPAWPSGVEEELVIRSTGGANQGVIAVLTGGPAAVTDTGQISSSTWVPAVANPLTGGAAFDYWQIESNNPVTRGVVCNIVTPPSASLAGYTGPPTATDFANYNADISSVLAEFAASQFLLVDCDGALGQTSSLFASSLTGGTGGTNIHPNDRGYAILAQAVYRAIIAWVLNIPINEQAMQSRVGRRPTSRSLAVRRYTGSMPVGTPNPVAAAPTDLLGRPAAAGQDYVLPSTLSKLDAVNLQVTLDVQVGDEIQAELYGMVTSATSSQAAFDVAFLDGSGNLIRFFSGNIGTDGAFMAVVGWPAWYVPSIASAQAAQISGSAFATVMPGDVPVGMIGVVTLALYGQSGGGSRSLYGGGGPGSPPLIFQARNLGARNTPGFNTS